VAILCICAVGMLKLIETVEAVVRDVLGGMSLKDSVTSTDVRDMVCEVRRRIETQCDNGSTTPTTGLYRFMLPDQGSMANAATQVGPSACLQVMLCVFA